MHVRLQLHLSGQGDGCGLPQIFLASLPTLDLPAASRRRASQQPRSDHITSAIALISHVVDHFL